MGFRIDFFNGQIDFYVVYCLQFMIWMEKVYCDKLIDRLKEGFE